MKSNWRSLTALSIILILILPFLGGSPKPLRTQATSSLDLGLFTPVDDLTQRLKENIIAEEAAKTLAAEEEAARVEAERLQAIATEDARVNRLRFPVDSGWYTTSHFGTRCDVAGAYYGCVTHTGLDTGVYNQAGWQAYPIAKGIVLGVYHYDGPWPTCGNWVAVYHEQLGFTSIYCHLAATHVSPGQFVDPDTSLGEIGTTGMSNGIHLHLGFYHGQDYGSDYNVFDPYPWLVERGLM